MSLSFSIDSILKFSENNKIPSSPKELNTTLGNTLPKTDVEAIATEVFIEKLMRQSRPPTFSPFAGPSQTFRPIPTEPDTLDRSLATGQKVSAMKRRLKRKGEEQEESALEKNAPVAKIKKNYSDPITVHADCFKTYLANNKVKYEQKIVELRELLDTGKVTIDVLDFYHHSYENSGEASVRRELNGILKEIIKCHSSNYSLAFTSKFTKGIPRECQTVGEILSQGDFKSFTGEFWSRFVANIVIPDDINKKMRKIGES